MKNKLIAALAISLLILPLLACGSLRTAPSYKWHLILEVDPLASNRAALTQETAEVLRTRLNRIGLKAFKVDIVNSAEPGRVRVDLPETPDAARLKHFIVSHGLLQLVHVISDPSPASCQTYETEEAAKAATKAAGDRTVLPYPNSNDSVRWVVVGVPAIVQGRDLSSASAVPNVIGFTLRSEGAEKFGAWTAANINQYLGVVLNDEVKSIAYIRSQIRDVGKISGRFSKESAEDLAEILNSGPLPARVTIIEEGQN